MQNLKLALSLFPLYFPSHQPLLLTTTAQPHQCFWKLKTGPVSLREQISAMKAAAALGAHSQAEEMPIAQRSHLDRWSAEPQPG